MSMFEWSLIDADRLRESSVSVLDIILDIRFLPKLRKNLSGRS